MMGKFLMYLYLLVAVYCLVNVYMSFKAQTYQLTILMMFLTFINLVLFTIFRKDDKSRQIRGIQGVNS
jgi:nicotinamide riboside transporter PnuC